MSENKHTPGPWQTTRCQTTNPIPTYRIDGPDDGSAFPWHVARITSVYDDETDAANAALIAAAPDLLAALRYLVREATANGMLDVEPAIVQASAAIREATKRPTI